MSGISVEEAHAILGRHDLIAIGAQADEERRRRHGKRTTFLRVFEIHVDGVPLALPQSVDAGELRLVGEPRSFDEAAAAVKRAKPLAKAAALTAFSLGDLWDVAGGDIARLGEGLASLKAAGLDTIAEAPIDMAGDAAGAIGAAHAAGLRVPRLTVRAFDADRRVDLVQRAREVQSSAGGIRTFAPLPRVTSIAQPTTGYDDVKQVALARLLLDNIDSIQVDWALYGPKLAQVALTMGADDVDGVSPMEGDLGRRRSPIEEIRGNIRDAGLEAVERDGRFEVRE